MARKTAFVNKMILKTLNKHQQTVPPTVQKAATLDDKVGEILNRKKNVDDHDKAKLYSDVLQKYLTAKEQITPTGNLSPVVTQMTPFPMYSKTRAENMLRFLRQAENYIGRQSVVSRSGNHGQ